MLFVNIILAVIMSVFCVMLFTVKKSAQSENKVINTINQRTKVAANKYYWLLVALTFILAAAVRLYKFGIIPYGFNQDEAMASLEGLSLLQNGTDHYGMSLPVYFTAWNFSQMNVMMSYLMVPIFKIFGASVLTARLPVLIFSLISLWVIYRFSCRLFNRNAALAILFFTAICPWQIMASRWALEANMFPHIFLWGTYLLYLAFDKRRIYLYFSMAVFGFSMYAYGIAYYFVPLFLISACVYLMYKKAIKIRHAALCVLCYLIVSWPIFLMVIVNYFKMPSIHLGSMTIPFFPDGQRMNDILFFSDNMLSQLFANFLFTLKASIVQIPDLPWNSVPSAGTIYFCGIPLFISGLVLIIKKFKNEQKEFTPNKFGIYILITFLITAFVSGLITANVNINRINIIFYPMIIIAGYAVYMVCKRFNYLLIPVLLSFCIVFANFSWQYFWGDHSMNLGRSFNYGYSESLEYVKDKNYDKLYITCNLEGDVSQFSSELMVRFVLNIDVQYCIGNEEYKDKYIYGIPGENIDVNDTQSIYIIYKDEKEFFDEECFNFINVDNYYAVIHKDFKE